MKDLAKLVLVLFLICLIAGVLLATVNKVTERPIREAARQEKLAAIKKVLPEYDNEPDAETARVEHGGRTWTFYVARKNGRFAGAAFECVSPKGYGGDIAIMAGIDPEDRVHAIEVLRQKETPGLGAKIKDKEFKDRFAGRALTSTKWAVRKNGGDIDQITAATISSKAVVEAVRQGIDAYLANAESIRNSPRTERKND